MKKVLIPILLLGASLLNIGCRSPKVISPTISKICISSDFSKYKKLAVMPFSDAPGSPQSGEIVSALVSQGFAQAGFTILERSRLQDILNEQKLSNTGLVEDDQAIKLGKLMGVNAIVVGITSQYSMSERHTDTTYFDQVLPGQTRVLYDQNGVAYGLETIPGPVIRTVRPGEQWTESYVSISLRILDVETGQLLYSGSGQFDKGIKKPPQTLAAEITRDLAMGWTAK